MDIKKVALKLPGVILTYPFNPETEVYKVENKMFMLTDLKSSYISLKNDPQKNYFLRTNYDYITSGYHLNKEHWITISLMGDYDSNLVSSLILESYCAVIKSLPKKIKIKYSDYL